MLEFYSSAKQRNVDLTNNGAKNRSVQLEDFTNKL